MRQKPKQQKKKRKRDSGVSLENYPYANEKSSVLVVGDGDFTFSRGLIRSRTTGNNVTATTFDTFATVKKKYSNATECISEIKRKGGKVIHGIDATKLDQYQDLLPLFQYIVFNFPHTGQQRVHLNRVLLESFFTSAREKLVYDGEVHVALKTRPPYSNWNIEEQAQKAGLVLKARTAFQCHYFPGYNHRTTDPDAKKFEPQHCKCYSFVVDRSKYPVPEIKLDVVKKCKIQRCD